MSKYDKTTSNESWCVSTCATEMVGLSLSTLTNEELFPSDKGFNTHLHTVHEHTHKHTKQYPQLVILLFKNMETEGCHSKVKGKEILQPFSILYM